MPSCSHSSIARGSARTAPGWGECAAGIDERMAVRLQAAHWVRANALAGSGEWPPLARGRAKGREWVGAVRARVPTRARRGGKPLGRVLPRIGRQRKSSGRVAAGYERPSLGCDCKRQPYKS